MHGRKARASLRLSLKTPFFHFIIILRERHLLFRKIKHYGKKGKGVFYVGSMRRERSLFLFSFLFNFKRRFYYAKGI